jgi:serine/threonine protein kinase
MKIGIEVCKGLEHAHARKVIHRDLKPANILLGKDGSIKIADFGIARISRDSISRMTSMQDSGTLLYMSPEQLIGKSSEVSDLYSWGVVLFEMLSGDPPFNSGDISYQIREVAPPSLDGVSPELGAIVLRCLAKKPEERFSNVRELREQFETGGRHSLALEPEPTKPIAPETHDIPPPVVPTQRPTIKPVSLKETLANAMTIRIRQNQGNLELSASVERELLKWRRFAVVSPTDSADLQLDIAPTSELDVWTGKGAKAVATLTSQQGARLWSTVKGGDWSLAGWSLESVGKEIIKELRKMVEKG